MLRGSYPFEKDVLHICVYYIYIYIYVYSVQLNEHAGRNRKQNGTVPIRIPEINALP